MEKDNIKENQIKSEVEETEVQTSEMEATKTEVDTNQANSLEENTNVEIHKLINNEDKDEDKGGNSFTKVFFASILDQVLIVAASAVLVLLCSVIIKLFGYMFVEGTGAIFAAGIIYIILNCFYTPIMENSKGKNTIGKKILNI